MLVPRRPGRALAREIAEILAAAIRYVDALGRSRSAVTDTLPDLVVAVNALPKPVRALYRERPWAQPLRTRRP